MNKITVNRSVLIQSQPEKVWDFTQDWNRRGEWDSSIIASKYLKESAPAVVQVRAKGGLSFLVTYKMSDRPRLTTLAMTEMNSFWFKGGGGSWKYENQNGSTLWTQHNTLVLREGFLGKLFAPLFSFVLRWTTLQIMKRAKAILETGN